MVIGNERKTVEEGSIVYIPPREVHALMQIGEKPLRFITVSVDLRRGIEREPKPPYVT